MSTARFEDFNRRRQSLGEQLVVLAEAFDQLGVEARARQLRDAHALLESQSFRLMVVGEFKRGKSTTINALLGRDVLPAKVAPCTAVITEVKYGDPAKARLHLDKEGAAPLDIAVEDIRKYVVIDEDADDGDEDKVSETISKSPYSLMELFYPLKLCQNGVEIVDSPGLNEHKTRQKVALDYLSRADALVMVLSCDQALSESEIRFIDESLGGRNLRHVFFLWNRWDLVADSADDAEDIRRRSRKYLVPRAGSDDRIFYISSRQALLARKKGDAAGLAASNLQPFERALEQFLATERGRVKLSTPMRAAERAILDASRELLPQREAMLQQPISEIRRRYEEQLPRLGEIERQRDRLLLSVERRRDRLVQDAMTSYRRLLADIEANIGEAAARIPIDLVDATIHRTGARNKVGEELQAWLSARLKDWHTSQLAQITARHVADLEDDLDKQAAVFLQNVSNLRDALVPDMKVNLSGSPGIDGEEVTALSRLAGAVGGFFIGGVGSAIEGGAHGAKAMLKGLAPNIAIGTVLVVAGFGAPVVVAALAAFGIWKTVTGAKGLGDRLREDVATKILETLRASEPETEKAIAEQVGEAFGKIHGALDQSTRIAIDQVAGQVQAILKEKQNSEQYARDQLAVISSVRKRFGAATQVLDAIRAEIEG